MTTHLADNAPRLREGWHYTERYGEVYVSPGGTAWVVRQSGNELKSVSVPLTPAEIVKTPATELRKEAILRQQRRKRRGGRTSPPNFGTSAVRGTKQAVVAAARGADDR